MKWALYALSRDKTYVPRLKDAFPVGMLQQMVKALPLSVHGNIIRTAVLIMYHAALRQSEVLPHSARAYDPCQHLSRADLVLHDDRLTIFVKFAKNLQTVYQYKKLTLQPSPDREVCVVDAVRCMIASTPTFSPLDPAIMFQDSRRPVTVEYVRRNWTRHIAALGMATNKLSLHSIRKAAATAAHDQGCDELEIQRYGGWRSNAHRQYITTTQNNVNSAIVHALNHP